MIMKELKINRPCHQNKLESFNTFSFRKAIGVSIVLCREREVYKDYLMLYH